MNTDTIILIAEDDPGHASLIRKNLKRSGIENHIIHFTDGEQALDYLFRSNGESSLRDETPYILLLDINMPRVDGIEVLTRIKSDTDLKKLPVIMLTTTDDPKEIDKCYALGCNNYISKPVDYQQFTEKIQELGTLLQTMKVPLLVLVGGTHG